MSQYEPSAEPIAQASLGCSASNASISEVESDANAESEMSEGLILLKHLDDIDCDLDDASEVSDDESKAREVSMMSESDENDRAFARSVALSRKNKNDIATDWTLCWSEVCLIFGLRRHTCTPLAFMRAGDIIMNYNLS